MRRSFVLTALMMVYVFGAVAAAQELTDRGNGRAPHFLLASSSRLDPVDVSRVPLLGRRLSLELDGATLKDALSEISRRSGLRLVYSDDVLPRDDRRVQLRAEAITVAAALTDVLFDAGVDVVFSASGGAALVRRTATAAPAQTGTIAGRITDASTQQGQQGIEGVRVFLEGTRWATTTGSNGNYRLTGVAPGAYTLVTRRLGYKGLERAVVVEADREVTVDVALQPVPSALNEVVVTATGDQRRVELGHVVGRINADSLVKEAPISTLSELLTARVPGLQVFQSQGTVGGDVHLQIRGPNSLSLNIEPIVIVDGVRYTSGSGSAGVFGNEPTSRLNDLNPNDIETIEVVKGPSAATLYGTDAANGVLVITTKRGKAGPARWNAYGKADQSAIPRQRYPDIYWGWSGAVFGDPSLAATYSCTLVFVAAGYCTQDSVTVLPNPLNNPQYTIFGNKPQWEYGANVAGGRQDVRYYFSGNFQDATGPIQMPLAIAEQLRQQRGTELPEEWRNPNTRTNLNLRANVSAMLGEKADLSVNSGYVHGATRTLAAGGSLSPYSAAFAGTPTSPYGDTGFNRDPAQAFAATSTDRTERFVGSASGQWRPMSWLATRATVGLDLTSSNRYSLVRRGDQSYSTGVVQDIRGRQLATTANLGATATLRRGRLTSRSSVGAQYERALNDALSTAGFDLPPGGTSVGEAVYVFTSQSYGETVTLGSYLEERLSLNERIFLAGALRMDGASTFGEGYDAAAYPKADASWLLSEEPFLPRVPGLEELRLRYAYGASGQQPTSLMARPLFQARPGVENGAPIHIVDLIFPGNPALRPERVREHEFGFDATALGSQLALGLTWHRRRTVDQIVGLALPPGAGFIYTNLGLTTQRGFEAVLTARVLDTRLLTWDLTLQHGSHTTKLVDLGEALQSYQYQSSLGGWAEGYPLGARFQPPLLGYTDANGDGIISYSEVQVDYANQVYAGESTPPRSQTLTTVLDLFARHLRLSALLERRTGFTQLNALTSGRGTSRAEVDPTTPLATQVQTQYLLQAGGLLGPGDFTRLREVTAALDLPLGVARALRLRSATLALSVRNLALWTAFSGPDPESAARVADIPLAAGQAEGVPQARSWTLRLDLGL